MHTNEIENANGITLIVMCVCVLCVHWKTIINKAVNALTSTTTINKIISHLSTVPFTFYYMHSKLSKAFKICVFVLWLFFFPSFVLSHLIWTVSFWNLNLKGSDFLFIAIFVVVFFSGGTVSLLFLLVLSMQALLCIFSGTFYLFFLCWSSSSSLFHSIGIR